MANLTVRLSFILRSSLLAVAALFALQCGSDKPSQPTTQIPDITQFSAAGNDIVPGDSTLATYAAVRADSIVLTPGQKLANPVTGSIYLKPAFPTRYVLRAYNSAGQDSLSLQITMSSAAASLTLGLSEDTIVTGDSTTLSYSTLRADSVVLLGVAKLSPVASGTRILKPTANITYTAVAYSPYGNDTGSVAVRVEVPFQLQIPNGRYFKGEMGSAIATPEMRFRVVDFAAQALRKVWVHFRLIDGDGALSLDSARAGANGLITLAYSFSGIRSDAVIRAVVPSVDSTDVLVRAKLLVPGNNAQAQYILLTDSYQTIKGFNGSPVAIDPYDGKYLRIANYESTLGFVAVIDDANHNDVADDPELVNTLVKVFADERTGLIVNTVNTDTTVEGIGVGSTYSKIRSLYGLPDSAFADPTPDSLIMYYAGRGLTFFCGTNIATNGDTVVAEIHLWKP